MIVKVLDDQQQDRFLVEAAFIRWNRFDAEDDFIILEVHVIATQSAGSISMSGIEEDPSLRLRIYHGDRVFIMNDEGRTIDSKRIQLREEEE